MTCFGQCGRTKILTSYGGTIVITKDCQQLLPHYKKSDALSNLFAGTCLKHSERYGDGAMTLAIVTSSLLHSYGNLLKRSDDASTAARINIIRAIGSALHVIHSSKDQIIHTFRNIGVLYPSKNAENAISILSQHILTPASNSSLAHNLSTLLVNSFPNSNRTNLSFTTDIVAKIKRLVSDKS